MSAESRSESGNASQRNQGSNEGARDPWIVNVPHPLKFWHHPEDPDKPPLPYVPGLTLEIDRHVPPSPRFAQQLRETDQTEPILPTSYLRSVPQSKVVVDKSPLDTEPPISPETARLVVTAPIAVGAGRGSQIVTCNIYSLAENGGAQPFQAIAKIFDPLYYGFQSRLGGGPRDVVFWADQDYSKEAAAYEQLLKAGETGLSAPLYYGSWTFRLPIKSNGETRNRSVRLILIEQLSGNTIRDTRIQSNPDVRRIPDSFHYPEEYRLEVLAQAMDGFVRQLRFGVNQSGFSGRNVVLAPNPNSTAISGGLPLPRVVIIDYNTAVVDVVSAEQGQSRLPESPIQRFWNSWFWDDFGGWVPEGWQDIKLQRRWLVQRFNGEGTRQSYLPLPDIITQEICKFYGPSFEPKASLKSPRRSPTPPRVDFGLGPRQFRIFDPAFLRAQRLYRRNT